VDRGGWQCHPSHTYHRQRFVDHKGATSGVETRGLGLYAVKALKLPAGRAVTHVVWTRYAGYVVGRCDESRRRRPTRQDDDDDDDVDVHFGVGVVVVVVERSRDDDVVSGGRGRGGEYSDSERFGFLVSVEAFSVRVS